MTKVFEEGTICPIYTELVNQNRDNIQYIPCLREPCMWWIEDKQKCAIALIGGKK